MFSILFIFFFGRTVGRLFRICIRSRPLEAALSLLMLSSRGSEVSVPVFAFLERNLSKFMDPVLNILVPFLVIRNFKSLNIYLFFEISKKEDDVK